MKQIIIVFLDLNCSFAFVLCENIIRDLYDVNAWMNSQVCEIKSLDHNKSSHQN